MWPSYQGHVLILSKKSLGIFNHLKRLGAWFYSWIKFKRFPQDVETMLKHLFSKGSGETSVSSHSNTTSTCWIFIHDTISYLLLWTVAILCIWDLMAAASISVCRNTHWWFHCPLQLPKPSFQTGEMLFVKKKL